MSQDDETLLSPSQIFKPRNPGVVRTPPGERAFPSQPSQPTPAPSAPAPAEPSAPSADENAMDVDTETAAVSNTASQTPARPNKPTSSNTALETPGNPGAGSAGITDNAEAGPSTLPRPQQGMHTPRSTRKNRPVPEDLDTEPLDDLEVSMESDVGDHGKRWKVTLQTLELATKAASQKWTARDFKQCFPTLAADDNGEMDTIWLQAAETMKQRLAQHGMDVMKHYKVPEALQQIDEVVKEGEAYAQAHKRDERGRPDAWRPDTTPEVLNAATQLPIYDEAHGRIREEYLALHGECGTRYKSILEKYNLLQELEGGVADGVADLEKTIKLLDGFPNEQMMAWMEDSSATMPGARDQ